MNRSSCFVRLACLAAGLWFTLSAAAASFTLFSEDFESYSAVATSLDDTNDCNPALAGLIVQDDNPLGFTNGAGVQVQNFLVHGGSKALLLRSGTELRYSFFNARSGSKYTLDFWLNVHKTPGDRNFYLILKGAGADLNTDDYVAYRSDRAATAKIFYWDGVGVAGAGWIDTLISTLEDTWQHHRIVVDTATQKMNIYLDNMDTPVLADADISRGQTAVPTMFRIIHEGNSANDGYFAIDDLTLTVDGSRDLATTFTEGFESYPARATADDDADPLAPWITVEQIGTGGSKDPAPTKVQVVSSTEVPPHSGTKCLKLEGGQRAGVSLAWGIPPQSDVEVTWWARVPASAVGGEYNLLRMSLYGAEDGLTFIANGDTVGDNALLGYGTRSATVGDSTSLTYFAGTGWFDTMADFTPDVWEEYRLTTHSLQGRYTIIKNPSSASPQVVVDRAPMVNGATNWNPIFMAGWSSSNGSDHPPVYVDDITIKSLVSNPAPLEGQPYTVDFIGNRFTNFTMVNVGGEVGDIAIDPRDNSTILFTIDNTSGAIYQAKKVASGNWAVDPTPIVTGLDRPSGLAVAADGTIWWTHDYAMAVSRLKWPWTSNTPENVITNFGNAVTDDDPIDLVVAPAAFNGTLGKPGMIVVADRGSDGDAFNAIYLVDPATEAGQTNNTFLFGPDSMSMGANLNAITYLPGSNEVATLSVDGFITTVDANGMARYIVPATLWATGPQAGSAIAADPLTGRIWVVDDLLDEVWSVASDNTGADQKEVAFPLALITRPDLQLGVHEPGMSFSPDGAFLVLSDGSVINGGGRLVVLHNETIAVPTFRITQSARTSTSFELSWQSAGGVKYRVQRSTDLTNPAGFADISGDLTGTSFTDTNAPAQPAFYRVIAKP